MDWKLVEAILGVIVGVMFLASGGVIITTCISLWNAVLKAKRDYRDFMIDGVLTDAERMHLADDVILVIQNSATLFQFVVNLIAAIGKVIPKAVSRRARKIIK